MCRPPRNDTGYTTDVSNGFDETEATAATITHALGPLTTNQKRDP